MPKVTWDKSGELEVMKEKEEIKKSPKATKVKSKIATFISPYRFYKIRVTPMKMRYVEGVGKEAIPGTEKYIEFENWKFQTNDSKDIKFLINKGEFGINVSIDPSDPTGYWEDHGWFKREMVEQRIATAHIPDLAKEAQGNIDNILKTSAKKMAQQVADKQPKVTNLKTVGASGGEI